MAITLTKNINMATYFENLTFGLYAIYVLINHVKFYVNWILFTIRSIELFVMHNFSLQELKI